MENPKNLDELVNLAVHVREARVEFGTAADTVLADTVEPALDGIKSYLKQVKGSTCKAKELRGADKETDDHAVEGEYFGVEIAIASVARVPVDARVTFTKDYLACRILATSKTGKDVARFKVSEVTSELVERLVREELEAALSAVRPDES